MTQRIYFRISDWRGLQSCTRVICRLAPVQELRHESPCPQLGSPAPPPPLPPPLCSSLHHRQHLYLLSLRRGRARQPSPQLTPRRFSLCTDCFREPVDWARTWPVGLPVSIRVRRGRRPGQAERLVRSRHELGAQSALRHSCLFESALMFVR